LLGLLDVFADLLLLLLHFFLDLFLRTALIISSVVSALRRCECHPAAFQSLLFWLAEFKITFCLCLSLLDFLRAVGLRLGTIIGDGSKLLATVTPSVARSLAVVGFLGCNQLLGRRLNRRNSSLGVELLAALFFVLTFLDELLGRRSLALYSCDLVLLQERLESGPQHLLHEVDIFRFETLLLALGQSLLDGLLAVEVQAQVGHLLVLNHDQLIPFGHSNVI